MLWYMLFKVIDEDRSCIVPVTFHPQHIIRTLSNKMNCGTVTQPWILDASLGQQINIQLLDFNFKKSDTSMMMQESICYEYGFILEKSVKKNATICGRSSDRNTLVYKSSSNVVKIVLDSPHTRDINNEYVTYLLRFIGKNYTL